MKTNLKLLMIAFLAIMTACSPEDGKDGQDGAQGIQGEAGQNGQDGNANVSSYTFSVNRSDWGDNLHYGGNNIFRAFNVSPELLGGNDMAATLNNGGSVLIYSDGGVVQRLLALPFSFSNSGIGIKLNAAINSSDLLISKTTNGWDNVSIAVEEIPQKINYIIVLIPKENQAKMDAKNIDLSDYNAVAKYYNLQN
ncbi:MAG TPA: hypothetical protein PLV43_08315 [Aequorivita sp.]|nr:hypothetical protein [Aequorivita sp.]